MIAARLSPRPSLKALTPRTPVADRGSAHEHTNQFVAEALEHLDYPAELQSLLLTPQREVAVELAIRRDSGEVACYRGYRVQVRWPARRHAAPRMNAGAVSRCLAEAFHCTWQSFSRFAGLP